jgi:serine/threonine-protein kinase
MLAGQPPFNGETAFEVAIKHVRDEPPPLARVRPDLPEALCAIVHKMMAKAPQDRYQTGRELLRDVLKVREGVGPGVTSAVAARDVSVELVPVATPSSGSLTTPEAPRRRRWLAVLVVLSLLLAAGGGAAYAWWLQHQAQPPPGDKGDDPLSAEEKSLRVLVDKALDPANGFKDVPDNLRLCLKLGVFYLENDRYDKADELFARLEGLQKQAHPYYVLGVVGRGVTLALLDRPKESAQHFRDAATLFPAPPRRGAESALLQDPHLRFWIAKALRHNRENGAADADVLPPFRQFLPQPPKDRPRPP